MDVVVDMDHRTTSSRTTSRHNSSIHDPQSRGSRRSTASSNKSQSSPSSANAMASNGGGGNIASPSSRTLVPSALQNTQKRLTTLSTTSSINSATPLFESSENDNPPNRKESFPDDSKLASKPSPRLQSIPDASVSVVPLSPLTTPSSAGEDIGTNATTSIGRVVMPNHLDHHGGTGVSNQEEEEDDDGNTEERSPLSTASSSSSTPLAGNSRRQTAPESVNSVGGGGLDFKSFDSVSRRRGDATTTPPLSRNRTMPHPLQQQPVR